MHFGHVPAVDVREIPEDALLVDVREHDEWDAGHAEGALHVPMGEFVERLGELTEQAGDRRMHVVCRVGGRSAQVTRYLVQQGFDAVNVEGGMQAWAAAGRPLTGKGDDPFVL
ncbi:rhodanese-like domain-containing protein [Streptomyces alkaliterrae]|uniref:Rhodanese-like domain-containing protein n=1 Tax=Streptomyces alkaliterrae TaxID=2213162 RepID=A0A5P0YRI9_9ACTN|nr:rhodanese-like domain-containing protein [Streptomyces alkaliterrae]MBB1253771.1 rhodanese-like domain-containing protein [Streptomyces alkaliterrae]MBB1258407.1 rhodanese-like domain-containing protein [Streptomyces alkaliterrae]MQS02227.1 rhodanese-like domain-containing protein [Streptomyces alkaliterrae]